MLCALAVACATCAASACGSDGQTIRDVTIVGPDGRVTELRLPARLDRLGLVPARACQYRVRAQVAVAPALVGHELVLVVPSLAARAGARADGEALGVVRGGAARGYRQRPPLAWTVPARLTDDGVLELELEVDHTWTQSAWLSTEFELVRVTDGLGRGTWVEWINLPLAVAGLAVFGSIGLVMLWRFFIDRTKTSRHMSGLFALQAITAAVYPLYVMGALISLEHFEIPLTTASLAISITGGIYYTRAFFELPRPSRGWVVATAALGVACVAFADPFQSTDISIRLMIGYLTVCLCAIFVTIVRVLRTRRDRETWLYLLAWTSLGLSAAPDMLSLGGVAEPLDGGRTGVVGLMLFSLLMELLLNHEHFGSLHRVNVQLEGRVQDLEVHRGEIEQLNTELRRQISDRAGQIQAALALARRRGGAAPVLNPGELVQGRYRVERAIGAGGMGTVYEVTRLIDGRRLALKLAREVSGDALARMAREAQTAATVTNPHVVAMMDVDVASAGFLFIVMELVDGVPLSSQHARFGDRRWALEVLAQLADGLAALHRVGVIHRDLKPANVLIAQGDDGRLRVKISDFGISVAEHDTGEAGPASDLVLEPPGVPEELAAEPLGPLGPDDSREMDTAMLGSPSASPSAPLVDERAHHQRTGTTQVPRSPTPAVDSGGSRPIGKRRARGGAGDVAAALTRTGMMPGTPAYMAPELIEGRHRLVVATDVFAFGVIARELLVGARPYLEPAFRAMLAGRSPPPVSSLGEAWPEAPADLARLLDACIELRPELRPNAAELAAALGAAVASQHVAAGHAEPVRTTP